MNNARDGELAKAQHVLVTGGGGFIGRHLVRDQVHRGNRVRALDCRSEGLLRCPGLLVWVEDDRVECQTCGAIYDPRDGKVHAYRNSDGRIEDAGDA